MAEWGRGLSVQWTRSGLVVLGPLHSSCLPSEKGLLQPSLRWSPEWVVTSLG